MPEYKYIFWLTLFTSTSQLDVLRSNAMGFMSNAIVQGWEQIFLWWSHVIGVYPHFFLVFLTTEQRQDTERYTF